MSEEKKNANHTDAYIYLHASISICMNMVAKSVVARLARDPFLLSLSPLSFFFHTNTHTLILSIVLSLSFWLPFTNCYSHCSVFQLLASIFAKVLLSTCCLILLIIRIHLLDIYFIYTNIPMQ